nr:hypothetical protein [Chloroflexota bacterium]
MKTPLLLLLSFLVDLLSYPSLCLKAILLGTPGRLILTGVYFILVANPLVLKARTFKPTIAFAATLALFLSLYALSLQCSPAEEVFAYTFLAFHDLLGLVSLFWIWMGLDLFTSAQKLTDWCAEQVKTLMPRKILGTILFALLVLWVIIAYLLVHGPTPTPLNQHWGQVFWKAYLSGPFNAPRPSAQLSALSSCCPLPSDCHAMACAEIVIRDADEPAWSRPAQLFHPVWLLQHLDCSGVGERGNDAWVLTIAHPGMH